jgi:uncharacterized alkaline shock family protein YloU
MTDPNPARPTVAPQPLRSGLSDSDAVPNSQGRTVIADTVVAKIAGIAAREIGGVREVSGGASRMVGRLRETVPGAFAAPSNAQGVSVEVGERQAAVDIGIVAYYGVALHELAAAIRRNVIAAIERMTGLEVTEVNVTVHDVWFDDDDETTEPDARPRVQ